MKNDRTRDIVERVRGVVFPILTPFTAEGEVDAARIKSYVEFLIGEGARILMVTVGTSRFNVLTDDEMRREIGDGIYPDFTGKKVAVIGKVR